MTSWAEGDRLIAVAYKWIAQKHEAAGGPLFATSECCQQLEDVVERTFTTRDSEQLKTALKTFAHHMIEHFEAASSRRQQEAPESVG